MTEKKVVLIVDDSKIDRVTLKQILKDSYEVIEAESGQKALEILATEAERVSAIILDIVMPEMSGFEYMQIHKRTERLRTIPIIVTTVEGTTRAEEEALELGAWDFITKPYEPKITRFRIKNVIDRSQLQITKELRYRAEYDILTGIYNKAMFFQTTRELLDAYPDETFAYIRMDIEKFQLVNTFFGMTEGDKLLRHIGSEIQRMAVEDSMFTYGRIEADIFGICVPYHGEKALVELVEKAREHFRSYELEFDIDPIFGIYIIDDPKLSINDMDDRANLATKKCKENYFRSYEFYIPEMSTEIVKEQRIINRMRKALEDEEFVLYLQPKYALQQKTISGAEVLVRWRTADQGMISPGEFIPVFERNGFIMQLDFYVWEKTCQLLAKWLREGEKPYPVSVNISRVSLYNPKLVENICGLVEKYRIPPRLLQLELTESAYTNNPVAIKDMMERLQKAGFTILMDDFGSGYSSLNVLKDIPVDVLKIDMKFLSDTDKQGRSENILASVVRMAKWLNMPVVAEGVERGEQVSFLRSIGCEYVQGYYFARPMPAEDYEKLVCGQSYQQSEVSLLALKDDKDSLWNSTSQMEILFSNMLQAVAVYEYENDNLDVIKVNNAYYDLFGYGDINAAHRDTLKRIDETGRKGLLSAFRTLVETKEVTECEFLRELESGKKIWIQLKLKYISQVGTKHVIFGTLSDITQQRALDEELQKYRAALAGKNTGQRTILVVDDLELNRVSLRCIFEEKYRVLEAENGQQALDVLKAEDGNVDVILLDLMMPVMDGTSFLEYKNADAAIAGIPVIMISADDTTNRQIQTLKLGAEDYIVKPFIPELAIRRVENVLKV